MARTLKQIREQNALRSAAYRQRKIEQGGQPVCVWVWEPDHAKEIRSLADKLEAKRNTESK